MDRELMEEWGRLDVEARAILKRPPVRDGVLTECHAVVLPSLFENYRSYTILVAAATGRLGTS
jgi:hypothetical protein